MFFFCYSGAAQLETWHKKKAHVTQMMFVNIKDNFTSHLSNNLTSFAVVEDKTVQYIVGFFGKLCYSC